MISITLQDVIIIIGFFITGDELHSWFFIANDNLDIEFYRSTSMYPHFTQANGTTIGTILDKEHNVFLLYCMCKYFIYTSPKIVVFEYSTFASLLLTK